ncbi:hypothetical protein SAMN05216548_10424 [Faunimonas pinastri]|uniref:Uncharacterized protein n=1 Tax=Faunimonas pinastri TaxID=1855383 RepID=A0A1H9F744_9HYPH|nr:hypothetical protein [Faunimonas pinastri]SEQ33794.1 hypothetical protein SAMN05216548_10424 [Faunimonas pinastri]
MSLIEKLRPSTPQERRALKSITETAIEQAGGPVSMQWATRVEAGDLTRYGKAHYAKRFVPIDVALDIDRRAPQPFILQTYAAILGFGLTRVASAATENICEIVARLVKETAEVWQSVTEGLSDGVLDRRELDCAIRELDEQMDVASRLRAHLEHLRRELPE